MKTTRNQAEKLWQIINHIDDKFIDEAENFLSLNLLSEEQTFTVYDTNHGIVVPNSYIENKRKLTKFARTVAGFSSIAATAYLLLRRKSESTRI